MNYYCYLQNYQSILYFILILHDILSFFSSSSSFLCLYYLTNFNRNVSSTLLLKKEKTFYLHVIVYVFLDVNKCIPDRFQV